MSLVLVQGLIVVVGIAAAAGSSGFGKVILDTIEGAAPGPAGSLLTRAVKQANTVGGHDRYIALSVGLIGLLVTATTSMGQLERGLNRIYGVELDRPFREKYGRALLLAFSAGLVIATSFILLAFGHQIGIGRVGSLWLLIRWPLGVGLLAIGLAILFRWSPNRRQPGRAWLAFGAGIAVVLLSLVTVALALFFRLSSSFGDTYGPFAGVVALQIWTFLSAISIFYGAAVAAQLEGVRAGVPAIEPGMEHGADEVARATEDSCDPVGLRA